MVRPSLVEVMEHDGPICARGPSGRGPVSLVRIRLCFILAAFRDKRVGGWGVLCVDACAITAPDSIVREGAPRATLSNALLCTWDTEIPAGAEVR